MLNATAAPVGVDDCFAPPVFVPVGDALLEEAELDEEPRPLVCGTALAFFSPH